MAVFKDFFLDANNPNAVVIRCPDCFGATGFIAENAGYLAIHQPDPEARHQLACGCRVVAKAIYARLRTRLKELGVIV